MLAQDPYLLSQELGHTIDEVEQLLKKHEAFEKSAAAQEERFSALERLTTVSTISNLDEHPKDEIFAASFIKNILSQKTILRVF